jgi:hypothetical protein
MDYTTRMTNIEMSLDDTLELDTIIEEWNPNSSLVDDVGGNFNISGFQTSTTVLDPQNTGTHKININGQELTVKVTDTSTIPDSIVIREDDNNTFTTTIKRGVVFNSTKSWNNIGFKISQLASGFSSAYIGTHSNNSVMKTKDVSSLSSGDIFTFDVNLSSNTDYFIALDNNGSSFTVGENRTASNPTTSNDGILTIKGKYSDSTSINTSKNANILSIGNIGF